MSAHESSENDQGCAHGKVAFFSAASGRGSVFQSHGNRAGRAACGNAVAAIAAALQNDSGQFDIELPESECIVVYSKNVLPSGRVAVSQTWTAELGSVREFELRGCNLYAMDGLNRYVVVIKSEGDEIDCAEVLRAAGFCDPATARMCVLYQASDVWHAQFFTCGGQRPHPSCPMTGAVVLAQLAELPAFKSLKRARSFLTNRGREDLPVIRKGSTFELPQVEVELEIVV